MQHPLADCCKVPVWALSLWRKNGNIIQPPFLLKLEEKSKQNLEERSLKASMCVSAASCISVQHHCFTAGSAVGSQLASGCDVDLQESPNGVHSVEHPQREAEVHDHKPGGVAVK